MSRSADQIRFRRNIPQTIFLLSLFFIAIDLCGARDFNRWINKIPLFSTKKFIHNFFCFSKNVNLLAKSRWSRTLKKSLAQIQRRKREKKMSSKHMFNRFILRKYVNQCKWLSQTGFSNWTLIWCHFITFER